MGGSQSGCSCCLAFRRAGADCERVRMSHLTPPVKVQDDPMKLTASTGKRGTPIIVVTPPSGGSSESHPSSDSDGECGNSECDQCSTKSCTRKIFAGSTPPYKKDSESSIASTEYSEINSSEYSALNSSIESEYSSDDDDDFTSASSGTEYSSSSTSSSNHLDSSSIASLSSTSEYSSYSTSESDSPIL